MKKLFLLLFPVLLVFSCSPSRKLPATTTTVDPRPQTSTKPVTEKNESPSVLNSNMASISGRWKFESSSEKDFGQLNTGTLPELSFNENERKVSGSTGCNNLNGFFFTSGNQFNFSPLAIDKKGCPDASVEKYIKSFFKGVGFYKTEGSKLFFYSKSDKNKYVVFSRK